MVRAQRMYAAPLSMLSFLALSIVGGQEPNTTVGAATTPDMAVAPGATPAPHSGSPGTADVALVPRFLPTPSSGCEVHVTLAPVYLVVNSTPQVCPTSFPASPHPGQGQVAVPNASLVSHADDAGPAAFTPLLPSYSACSSAAPAHTAAPATGVQADDGFWRQVNGSQVWIPTLPLQSTSPGNTEQEVVKEYGEWMASIGGESAPAFLSFAEWKQRHLAEKQREEQERRERRRKEKKEKKKWDHAHAEPANSNLTASATETSSPSSARDERVSSVLDLSSTETAPPKLAVESSSTLAASILTASSSGVPTPAPPVQTDVPGNSTVFDKPEEPPSPSPPVRRTLIPAQSDPGKELATLRHRRNFASADCAAQVQRASSSVKFASSILNEKKDRYLLAPCPEGEGHDMFVTIELCSEIKIDTLVLANYEFFSRVFKRVRLRGSKSLTAPLGEWSDLGTYLARNMRGPQVFDVPPHLRQYLKYIRIDLLDYYGSEAYCPLSLLRVYGLSHFDGWELEDFEDKRKEQEMEEEELRIEEEEEDEEVHGRDKIPAAPSSTPASASGADTPEPTYMSDALREMMMRSLQGLNASSKEEHYSAEDDREFSRWSDAPPANWNESSPLLNTTLPLLNTTESNTTKPRRATGRPTPAGAGGESIYRSITRRLSALEANASLSLQYMEQSGQMLLDAVRRMDRTHDAQLALLNLSNANEVQALRRRHHIDLQRMVFESDVQRLAWAHDKAELVQRMHLLSSELHFERRMDAVQLVLLCVLFALVLLTRGTHTSALDRVLRRTPTVTVSTAPSSPRPASPPHLPPPKPQAKVHIRRRRKQRLPTRSLGAILTPHHGVEIIEVRPHLTSEGDLTLPVPLGPKRSEDGYVTSHTSEWSEREDTGVEDVPSPPHSPPRRRSLSSLLTRLPESVPTAIPLERVPTDGTAVQSERLTRHSTPRPLLAKRSSGSEGDESDDAGPVPFPLLDEREPGARLTSLKRFLRTRSHSGHKSLQSPQRSPSPSLVHTNGQAPTPSKLRPSL